MSDASETQENITIENLPPLFGQKILAEALGKSTWWCEKSRSEGTGPPFIKIGGAVRYLRDPVLKWIEACEVSDTGSMK